ncbi:dolichyl-diphosphooligosaccharide--protein glycosyltransferase subunit 1 isoform 1 [Tropilaelaps mercedesae]|uniref:Dolichyl-diphosphooligosaccharide--protein glycosyltransferase subunit 1 n=1 Tax=Tropilaelaps mercedesae TaxID=418985 RepID=A0A1V9Y2C9_9ACAR|nr:dolichyl-diphosphooligosaccharide--protein glycosyltransferase subunit 1 isoform 1 [Tropilaelaps mercedesae]
MGPLFRLLVFVALAGNVLGQSVGSLENTNIERTIDVASQLVRTTAKISVENKGTVPLLHYYFAVDPAEVEHLSYISATSEAIPLAVVQDKAISLSNAVLYTITLPTALSPGKTVKLDVVTVLTHQLQPYPAQLEQGEKQLVIYRGNHYQLSPYISARQITKIRLASNRVESFTNTVKPNAQSESSVTYGPYTNIGAYLKEPCKVHYENHKPFLVVKNLRRWIEVSHWGTIQVEETLDVKHEGAELKGSFSRYEFQREMGPSPAVKTFKTFLPFGAKDVYYRDEIGNISTSRMRVRFDSVEVELRPRFPLFGGWKTHYVLGYSIPTTDFLLHDGADGFVLKINFIDHIFDDAVVDRAVVKIVLPEGANNIRLKLPFSAKRHADERHLTYLDTIGRPVVVLSKDNLVEDHIQLLELHYRFNKMLMFQEPLLVAVALLLLFLTVIIYVRLDFSIRTDPGQELKWKLDSLLERAGRVQDKRDALYNNMDQALGKYKLSRDPTSFEATMKKHSSGHRAACEEMASLEEESKNERLPIGALEIIQELNRQDKMFREHMNAQVAILEKFISGKLNKQQYSDQELALTKKKQEVYDRIKEVASKL